MIHIGLNAMAKDVAVRAYRADHSIKKIFVLSPSRFAPLFASTEMTDPKSEGDGLCAAFIDWPSIIEYRYFYKLLQEIDSSTLVVVNECLRTQNRNDLTYNCIRNFLNQTPHVLIFQHLPLIDTIEDFMVLFDFATKSRWKRERFSTNLLREASIHLAPDPLTLRPIHVAVDAKTRTAYDQEKASLIEQVKADIDKDPHLIPRNLLLVSGKAKLCAVEEGQRYVGRNNRFKIAGFETFREAKGQGTRVVFELPHNFLDLCDLLAMTGQREIPILVADTKADAWYLQRYEAWVRRVNDAQAALHG